MCLNAVIGMVLHIESYRNIDLSSSGLYYLKFRVFHFNHNSKVATDCVPVEYFRKTEPAQLKKQQKLDFSEIEPAKIDKSYMHTKIFAIRFCEEEIELNDYFHIRCEIDIIDSSKNVVLYIESKLMFLENSQLRELENGKINKLPDDKIKKFACVSTKTYSINGILQGISEYAPITFEKDYYSIAQTAIHSFVLDFRYRNALHEMENNRKSREAQPSTESAKNKKYNDTLLQKIYGNTNQKSICIQKIEDIYLNYCKIITNSYNKIAERFYQFYEKTIKEQHKSSLLKYFPTFYYPENCTEPNVLKEKNTMSEISIETAKYLPEEDKKTTKASLCGRNDSLCISDVEENANYINLPQIKNMELSDDTSAIPPLIAQNESKDLHYMISKLLMNVATMGGVVQQCWAVFIEVLKYNPTYLLDILKLEFFHKSKLEYSELIYRAFVDAPSFYYIADSNITNIHSSISKDKRASPYPLNKNIHVRDDEFAKSMKNAPILFEEILRIPKPPLQKVYDEFGVHLFILVHGFQGCQFDMHIVRNNILSIYPEAMILCSKENEDHTDNDLEQQGKTLAAEIESYIMENCPTVILSKISFIGFSIGGVIIRAALPMLGRYKDKMCNFITFSSPHLGTMASSSSLIDAGMWVLKKLKKSTSLLQITLGDNPDFKECFLYKLSQNNGLSYFENIILASSYKDKYVPYESSRIEITGKTQADQTYGPIIKAMISNIMSSVQTNTIHRLDVDFVIKEKNLDTFIGRAAHIQFLDCDHMMKILFYRYSDYFD